MLKGHPPLATSPWPYALRRGRDRCRVSKPLTRGARRDDRISLERPPVRAGIPAISVIAAGPDSSFIAGSRGRPAPLGFGTCALCPGTRRGASAAAFARASAALLPRSENVEPSSPRMSPSLAEPGLRRGDHTRPVGECELRPERSRELVDRVNHLRPTAAHRPSMDDLDIDRLPVEMEDPGPPLKVVAGYCIATYIVPAGSRG